MQNKWDTTHPIKGRLHSSLTLEASHAPHPQLSCFNKFIYIYEIAVKIPQQFKLAMSKLQQNQKEHNKKWVVVTFRVTKSMRP
jgi:hypothetical protein